MRIAIALFIISFLFHSAFIFSNYASVFVYDEGVYALMVEEFSDNPSMVVPTITGEYAELKPPLFTWIYSAFYLVMKDLPLPVEAIMRLPSAFFSALSVSMIFLVARKLYDKKTAIAAALLFLTCPLVVFSGTLMMMEAFSVFLILAAVYFYITEKPFHGMVFLGLLVLTKWLYVIAPVLFITLYFIKRKELPTVLSTFLVIPFTIAFYFVIAYFFGSFDNAFNSIFLDLLRPVPQSKDFFLFLAFWAFLLSKTFPLSILFPFLALFGKTDFWKDRAVLAMGALAFLLPFAQYFISWYAIISIPAMALFVGKKMAEADMGKLFPLLLGGVVLLNILSITYVIPDPTVKEAAVFMKGKNIMFYETRDLYINWDILNERYRYTNESYLLLEQTNPGILFYRFNNSADYGNIHALFAKYNDTIPCVEYLMVRGNATIPSCYENVWQKGDYNAYASPGS